MDTVKIPGKDIFVYISDSVEIGGTYPIGCDDTCDIEITTSMIDTTTKCSKDGNDVLWNEVLPNINSVKITGSGLTPLLNSAGFDEVSSQQLILAQMKQLKVYVTWGLANTFGMFFGANAYLSTTKVTASVKDVVKYNYTLEITGPIGTSAIS
jgi:hypothetical protein